VGLRHRRRAERSFADGRLASGLVGRGVFSKLPDHTVFRSFRRTSHRLSRAVPTASQRLFWVASGYFQKPHAHRPRQDRMSDQGGSVGPDKR
jgi:hypothetical protein